MMKRPLDVVAMLCLALAGVSCGDPSLAGGFEVASPSTASTEHDVYEYQPLKPVALIDRSPGCATLTVGGVVAYLDCFHAGKMAEVVYTDSSRHLLLMAVRKGNTVSFPEGNVRVFATSEYWVAAQLSTEMSYGDLRFTVRSEHEVIHCTVNHQFMMFCRY